MNIEEIRIRLAAIKGEISTLENERGDLISLLGNLYAKGIRRGSNK